MSRVTLQEAARIFARLPPDRRVPGLDPAYVLADAAPDAGADPVFFAHRSGGEIWYHPIVRRAVPGSVLCDLESAYGYGGPVATTLDAGFLDEADAAWRDWCGENRVLAEFVRFHPLLENWRFSRAQALPNRTTVWIDLTGGEPRAAFQTRARTAVRKAERDGVDVRPARDEDDLRAFAGLYAENMARVGAGREYFFSWDHFRALRALPGARLSLAWHDGRIVAGAFFLAAGDCLEYHLSASDPVGRRVNAVNLLLDRAVAAARDAGLRRAHLGGGNDASPDNPLFFFKAGFSPRRAEFRIGRRIHRQADYDALVRDWTARHGAPSGRVLFYRDHPESER